MRDQYAGDISDFLKFALLRSLAGDRVGISDRRLGVAWYYNPANDGRADGRRREFCHQSKWQAFDQHLWRELRGLPARSVEVLERLPIWPEVTRFHRDPVPLGRDRPAWAAAMKAELIDASIVFLDPDNGIGDTQRHASLEEVAMMRQPGRAVVLIKFPARVKYGLQLDTHHQMLVSRTACHSIATLCTSAGPWFTILDGDDPLLRRAASFAQRLSDIEGFRCTLHHVLRLPPR